MISAAFAAVCSKSVYKIIFDFSGLIMGVSNVKYPLITGLIDIMLGEKPFSGIFANAHIPAIRRTPLPIFKDKR